MGQNVSQDCFSVLANNNVMQNTETGLRAETGFQDHPLIQVSGLPTRLHSQDYQAPSLLPHKCWIPFCTVAVVPPSTFVTRQCPRK